MAELGNMTRNGWLTLAKTLFDIGYNRKKVSEVLENANADVLYSSWTDDTKEITEFEKLMLDAESDHKADKDNQISAKHLQRISTGVKKYQVEILDHAKDGFKLPGYLSKAGGGIRKGELAYIIARSGSFKTAFLQNVIYKHFLENDGLSLFFSFEMPDAGIAGRALQIINDLPTWDLESKARNFKSGEFTALTQNDKIKTLENRMLDYYGRPLTIDEMGKYIGIAENMAGRPLTILCIDYLGYVRGDKGRSTYEKVSEIARDLKTELARRYNIPVLCLVQANRDAKDGTEEIFMHSGRDSGAIEESADFAYGLWQDKENDRVIGSILKNRRYLYQPDTKKDEDNYSYFELDINKSSMDIKNVNKINKPGSDQKRVSISREVTNDNFGSYHK